MITDHISNASRYFPISKGLKTALQYLAITDFTKLATGKYEIESDDVYALVR